MMEARAGNEVEADWRYEREGIVAAVVVRHRTATGAEFVRPEFFARQHVPVDKIKSILVSGVFVRGRGTYGNCLPNCPSARSSSGCCGRGPVASVKKHTLNQLNVC